MALGQRIRTLAGRILHPSTLHFLLLVASDPRYQPLFTSLQRYSPDDRLRFPSLWFAWRSIPVIEQYLANLESPRVLEWGAGGSTKWFSERGALVTSIEHDARWFEVCKRHLEDGVDLRHVLPGEAYADPSVDYSMIDCIVIDGVMRVDCARSVATRITNGEVKPGTLIIFDNSERDEFDPGITALEKATARSRSYTGTTCRDIDQMTTLFWA